MVRKEALAVQVAAERSLMSRVLAWLALSMAITVAGVYLSGHGVFAEINPTVYMLGGLGLVFAIQAAVKAEEQALSGSLLVLFALIEGLFIGPVVRLNLRFDPVTVGNALIGTIGIFLVAAAMVYLTGIKMAAWGRWLLGALLAGIVLMSANLFLHAGILAMLLDLSLGGVFIGLTVYDFERVKAERAGDTNALALAISLYLDFLNLFLILLSILGEGDG